MGNALRSSVFFRTILCDKSAELANLNTVEFPDGATAFDSESDTLFRLDKSAGTVFDSLLGSGLLIKPPDQSTGRWFADSISGSSAYYSSSYLVATDAVVMTANQWNYLGSTPSTFGVNAGNASAFVVDLTTGLVTYHGPPRLARVGVTASLLNASSATPIAVHAAISRSDDVVAGTTNDYSSLGEQVIVTANVTEEISVERIMLLNPSTTLRLALRNATNGDDITVSYYQLTVTPF
jgi:hypothetical protein